MPSRLSLVLALVVLARPALAEPVLGAHDATAIIMLPDDYEHLFTPDEIRATTQGTIDDFQQFILENSYGRASYHVQVLGPYALAAAGCKSEAEDPTLSQNQTYALREAVKATDPEVDWAAVREVFVISVGTQRCPMGSSGNARAARDIVTEEGMPTFAVVWAAGADNREDAVLIHEHAHTIGATHQFPWFCRDAGGKRIAVDHQVGNATSPRCSILPDDKLAYDRMCFPGATENSDWPAASKDAWGWLTSSEVATPAATATVFLAPMEVASTPVKAIRLPLVGSYYDAFYLENRYGPLRPPFDGAPAGVYIIATKLDGPAILNAVIEAPPLTPDHYMQRPLQVGVPFVDEAMGLTATLRATRNGRAIVDVTRTVAGAKQAGLAVSISASAPTVKSGDPLSLTVAATNAGPETAADVALVVGLATGMQFTSAAGSGWTCSAVEGIVSCTRPSLAVGAAPAVTLAVTAPAAGGPATVDVGIGGAVHDPDTHDNGASVAVDVQPPPPPDAGVPDAAPASAPDARPATTGNSGGGGCAVAPGGGAPDAAWLLLAALLLRGRRCRSSRPQVDPEALG